MGFSSASPAKSCLEIFKSDLGPSLHQTESITTATEGLIAYLDLLLEKQVIGEGELAGLIETLKVDRLTNPIDEAKADLESERYEHFKGMQEYIDRTDLDLKEILEWVLERLKEREEEREERSEVKRETKERTYQEIEWRLVPAGDFMMGEKGKKVPVTLTHPFEAMSTQVTQMMWVEVMGENPSQFVEGEHSIEVNVNGQLIKMQPDSPVESLTFWSMLVFANRLSERDGLKPAYDLSGIKWKKNTRAENGTLVIESGEIKINTKDGVYDPGVPGAYYEATGYRLPTEAEQEYLLRAAGKSDSLYHFGDNENELKDHAWHEVNSEGKTHPVGELKALIIQGSAFYDLMGNVWERGWDYHLDSLLGGEDPVGSSSDRIFDGRIQRGGSAKNPTRELRSAERSTLSGFAWPYMRIGDSGFRLVKTVSSP